MNDAAPQMEPASSTPLLSPVPDRRAAQRMMSTLRIGKLICDGVEELCIVRNISASGLMLRIYSPRVAGDRVVVELKADQSVSGQIVWVDADEGVAGIAFDQQVDVNEVLCHERSTDRRRARSPRIAARSRAKLKIDGTIHLTELCDLSQGGAKISFDYPVRPEEDVVLAVPGLRPRKCVMRWQAHGHTGLSFLTPLPLTELVEWLNVGREQAA